jgi:membrane associated rhomboid family serine protease
MFIPISSDGNLNHWPIMTGVMILLNLVAYPVQMSLPSRTETVNRREHMSDRELRWQLDDPELDPELRELLESDEPILDELEVPGWRRFALSHGNGLHPVQWLTSMYMHGSIVHLLGNMLMLWVCGLVVEGRIGAFWFALLYLGCGISQNAIGQLMFLFSPAPPSLGASGVIYSLLMVAALWAPGDNIQWLAVGRWVGVSIFEIPVLIMGAFYFLADFGSAMFRSFELGTPLLHVTGGVVGFVVGAVLLGLNRIDCDQQDMFSRLREARGLKPLPAHPKKKSKAEMAAAEKAQADFDQRLAVIDRTIDLHLSAGRIDQALATMKSRRQVLPGSQWEEARLLKLLGLLQQQKRWDEFLVYADEFDKRFDSRDVPVRLNVARIQLEEKGRPRKCIAVLKGIDQGALSPKQREAFNRLATTARQRIAAGELDFAD